MKNEVTTYKTKSGDQKRYEIIGTREEVSRKITLIYAEGTYHDVRHFAQRKSRLRHEFGIYYACEKDAEIHMDDIVKPAPYDGYLIWVWI